MTECISCAPGRYQDFFAQTSCENVCPPGTYARGSNVTQAWEGDAADVAPLAENEIPSTNQSCIPCPPGYYSDRNSSTVCKPCPLGYFSILAQSTGCDKCAAGFTTSVKGSTKCVELARQTAPGETTGTSLAIILAIIAAIIVTATLSYVIYKRKQQAKVRKQIEDMQESANLQ
jgi:hypothetical protein